MSDKTKGRVIRSPKKWMDDFDPSWGDVPNSLPEMTEDRIAAIQLDVMHFCAAKSDDDYARLVAELAAARKALEADKVRMLNVARGCHDYGGGYRTAETAEIFHHGIQTVINALEAFSKNPDDTQTLALERAALSAKGQTL